MNAKLAEIQPVYSDKNPKLDFYSHDGKYLYSSNWYKSVKHAWAHVARNPVSGYSIVALIERAYKNKATAVHATFARFPTRTTVSRLRALGIGASVKAGQACIDGSPI